MKSFKEKIRQGIPAEIPSMPPSAPGVNRAPARPDILTSEEKKLALKNALRYFPKQWHTTLAPEFAEELNTMGRIYMYRFRPTYEMHARSIDEYPAETSQAAAIMLMIQNNLDSAVAQHPEELITYGGNGTVFQNWAQYLLTMKYLSEMTEQQTLVLYSGHPLGLFPSHPDAPRLVITNGMVIPNYSSQDDYTRMAALGVTSYGQMTAGSFMYIGPQGIVHGTTITLLNAGRKYLGAGDNGLAGRIYVTSGLGGMSGAQAKAAVIAGAVCVIAEVNPKAIQMRHEQGWLQEVEEDLDKVVTRIKRAVREQKPLSLGYLGNVVDLWEKLAEENIHIDLGSDQTSLHNPWMGGYYPAGLTLEESNKMMVEDPPAFKEAVQESLRRQVVAINKLCSRGMHFWDYGNAFLLEASRAGAEGILNEDGTFKYNSYVEDIMGPIYFDYGFGPFRWVCTSGKPEDLKKTDRIAAFVLEEMANEASPENKQQLLDNLLWIRQAEENRMVVGSQARILYTDWAGRIKLALAFNKAVSDGVISAPVVLGRDHHDVSGTDSPYRETANIRDGSMFTADMAVQNVIGDAFRGATWVSLHNGGGVGWGEVINGGFGMLLDGSPAAERRAKSMLSWDVGNGLARRNWARNQGAIWAVKQAMEMEPLMKVTIPEIADDEVVDIFHD
ncbi:urocanate hydratase [Candidatus Fermentibacteria bacterium]|nr:MAG: urocanate hydratase [Candidatus Fermentibacteria bacterium]